MNRRRFIHATALTSLFAAQLRTVLAEQVNKTFLGSIGLQLYTVRHQLGKDRKGTLKAIKEMGYVQVEPYEFPKYKALVEDSKELGLSVNSTHIQWNSVLNPSAPDTPAFSKVLEEAQAAEIKHLIIPTIEPKDRQTLDGYKLAAEKMNRAAVTAKAAGIQLAYHNHTFEFDPMEGTRTGYDVLMDEFSADMLFEVDAFWVQLGKRDPAKLIRSLKGRVTQVHLKDLAAGIKLPEKIEGWWSLPVEAFASLGEGIIPVNPIIEAAKEAGVQYCHVEQDLSHDPIASIRRSLNYLRS
jgi:sugar phosphate isomerase/epimerase